MPLGVILILVLVGAGIIMGIRRKNEINALRPPKTHWRQGHKLRYVKTEIPKGSRPRRARTLPMSEYDVEELDGMFGAGDRAEDYD